MKTSLTAIALFFSSIALFAQPGEEETVITDRAPVKVQIDTVGERAGPSDTTRFSIGKRDITLITRSSDDDIKREVEITDTKDQKKSLTWWNGIDIGVNGILNSDYGFDLGDEFSFLEPNYGASRYIGFNFAELKGRLIGDYLGITTGMTFQFYNFKYDGTDNLFMGDSIFAVPSGDRNVSKNKLRVTYFGVPVMLEFNTSNRSDRSFHVTAGV
ncbi:MAG: hypothetical protein ABR572_06020, partial [Cryomorphaceae bacterium]